MYLNLSEICSKTLQKVDISVTEALDSALKVVQLVEQARDEGSFNQLYDTCVDEDKNLELDPPTQSRPPRIPKRFLNDGCQPHNFADPKSRCRRTPSQRWGDLSCDSIFLVIYVIPIQSTSDQKVKNIHVVVFSLVHPGLATSRHCI